MALKNLIIKLEAKRLDYYHSLLMEYIEENDIFNVKEKKNVDRYIIWLQKNNENTTLTYFYISGKMMVQGVESNLRKNISDFLNIYGDLLTAENESEIENIESENRWAIYKFEDDIFDEVAESIRSISEPYERENSALEYYHWRLEKNDKSVVVKQYYTGNLVIQGKSSDIFDELCTLIERNFSPNLNEIASRFIAQSAEEIKEIKEDVSKSSYGSGEKIKTLLKNTYHFLDDIDKKYLISSQCLLDLIKETGRELPEYSCTVMSAGKGFEGFAIKLFIAKKELDIENIKEDPKAIELNWDSLRKHLPVNKRDKYIINKLVAEWTRCRNFPMHSDPYRKYELNTLDEAERLLETICDTIEEAHNIFFPKV